MTEVIGYVRNRETDEVVPYYEMDDNGFNVSPWKNPGMWGSKNIYEEVDKPSPITVNDPIKPDHYHSGGIDVFTYIEANLSKEKAIGYHQASAIKYIIRAGKKGLASEDFKKAQPHLDKLKELSE